MAKYSERHNVFGKIRSRPAREGHGAQSSRLFYLRRNDAHVDGENHSFLSETERFWLTFRLIVQALGISGFLGVSERLRNVS